MSQTALRTVLVAGGGITGWCAAAALKRRAPFLDVTILASTPSPDALADRIACTLPSLLGFNADLGIGEADAVARTGSGYRLGSRFEDWADGMPGYVHAYGRYGYPLGPTAFHLHWVRALRENAPPAAFDSFCAAAMLARADRFVPPTPGTPFADHEYGLTLHVPRYVTMLRAFALHVGVREISEKIADVRLDTRGGIENVTCVGGDTLTADLFLDATGPEARLRGTIDTTRDDWSRWLPCDRVALADSAIPVEPFVLTPVTAHPAGWRWSSGAQSGIAYAASRLSDDAAERMLRGGGAEPSALIRIRPGTRPEPWRGNCIAIGDAATEIEPLEWCNLHLALSAIDRLITMLPGRTPTPIEAADFNRQARAEAERVRDFLAMHYRIARRDDPFWRDLAATEPPASLAHTLAQFADRGRLPFYEEETFTRDSWAVVLLGQGVLPRRIDPLVETMPAAQVHVAMTRLAGDIAAALPRIPTHAAYRAAQTRHSSR
jgi:tryptophan halogenase